MDWNNGLSGATSRMKRIALVVGACLFVHGVFSQTLSNSKLWFPITAGIAKGQVTEQPDLKGGHLQGVQLREGKLYVSGSSDRVAYLTIFAMQEAELKFIGTKKLGEKPMNHAGGFQLADNWLAIGIEDPISRRESQVQLIDVSTSKSFSAPPAFVLHRKGQQGRSTAGAVALLRRKDHLLLAVGSWNSTVIDFYISNGLDPYAADFNFKLWTSWDSREALRKTWTDRDYGSYQSIQLTSDSGVVYLSGFCLDGKINRVDVFQLNTKADPYTLVQKIGSTEFPCQEGLSFRYGAGYDFEEKKPRVLVINHDLWPETVVQLFGLTAD
jgi:hypothetical protein